MSQAAVLITSLSPSVSSGFLSCHRPKLVVAWSPTTESLQSSVTPRQQPPPKNGSLPQISTMPSFALAISENQFARSKAHIAVQELSLGCRNVRERATWRRAAPASSTPTSTQPQPPASKRNVPPPLLHPLPLSLIVNNKSY